MLYVIISVVAYAILGVLWVKFRCWRFLERYCQYSGSGVLTPGREAMAMRLQGILWLPIATILVLGVILTLIGIGFVLVGVGCREATDRISA